jgi:hypothetical protein
MQTPKFPESDPARLAGAQAISDAKCYVTGKVKTVIDDEHRGREVDDTIALPRASDTKLQVTTDMDSSQPNRFSYFHNVASKTVGLPQHIKQWREGTDHLPSDSYFCLDFTISFQHMTVDEREPWADAYMHHKLRDMVTEYVCQCLRGRYPRNTCESVD